MHVGHFTLELLISLTLYTKNDVGGECDGCIYIAIDDQPLFKTKLFEVLFYIYAACSKYYRLTNKYCAGMGLLNNNHRFPCSIVSLYDLKISHK